VNVGSGTGILVGTIGICVPDDNRIEDCIVGLNPTGGTAGAGNTVGIAVIGSCGNTIGGTTAAQRNVISNNSWAGIQIFGETSLNRIQGNSIGTDPLGTSARPNGTGISIDADSEDEIGGATATAGQAPGNLISGNSFAGIVLGGPPGITVRGNLIGTDSTGTAALPNGGYGVWADENRK